MNDLGMTLIATAGRVTLLAVAAVALYAATARRRPALAALVTAAFPPALLLVTLVAFCPLPDWWSWASVPAAVAAGPEAPRAVGDGEAGPAPAPAVASEQAAGLGALLTRWRVAWREAGRATATPPKPVPRWPALLAAVFLAGAALFLLRLLLGVFGAVRCRRRGRPVGDELSPRLVSELCAALGFRAVVAVREVDGLPGPATVGWLRPAVLLPPDWRRWGADDRRAVLAHELAHVRRRDYLARLAAGLGAALHFYHPLVWWLTRRLELEQELAADDLAAGLTGGRNRYLLALARVALCQDDRPRGRPVVVSMTGTLLRRVAMLRAKDGVRERGASRVGRAALLALLAAAVLGASALRSPGEKATAAVAPVAGPGADVEAGVQPFDLTYLAPDAVGAVALRPAAAFARPGMKKNADALNKLLDAFWKTRKRPNPLPLPVEEIEQVTCSVLLKSLEAEKEGGKTGLLLGLTMVRAVRPFDWKKHLHAAVPGTVEARHAGRAYYRLPKGALPLFGVVVTYMVPDDRTVVFHHEPGAMKAWLAKGKGPDAPWLADWKRVDRGLFAVALDNRDRRWLSERRGPEEKMSPNALAVGRGATSLVFGIDATATGFTFQAHAGCRSRLEAKKVARAAKGLLGEVSNELEEAWQPIERQAGGKAVQGAPGVVVPLARELLRGSRIEQEGASVRWRSQITADLAKLTEAMLAGELGL
jgi:beta-lactamase regulating signal transducer with metallopeptidase domain